MSDPTSSGEKSPTEAVADAKAKLTEFVNQNLPKSSPRTDAERIKSAVARLTSNSIDGLQGLASELQDMKKFLHSEVQRVQSEVDSALAGIEIIIETLEPLINRPLAPPSQEWRRAGNGARRV